MPLFTITIICLDCYWYFCAPFCEILVELMNFAHRIFYIYTRGLVLQQLKTPYITGITTIELNSHRYVILPFCWLKANETSRNNFCQVMADNRVTVVVSNKSIEPQGRHCLAEAGSIVSDGWIAGPVQTFGLTVKPFRKAGAQLYIVQCATIKLD